MVAVLAFSTLVQAAARVGAELVEVEDGGNLYVWHTPPPERAVVYIGKSASDKRLAEEGKWRELDPRVRIAVRYGAPIGNSQFGSQWEGPIGSIPDTLAVLAVDGDLSFGIPAPHTDVGLTYEQ